MARLAALGAASAAALLSAAPAASGDPGNIDGSFGTGGALVLEVGAGGQSAGNGIAAGSGLIVGGEALDSESKLMLLRLDANGTPASLATTLSPGDGDAAGAALALQTDGKPLVAGYSGASGNLFTVARYTGDGALDAGAFGTTGLQSFAVGNGGDSAARAIALYPPDKLVAAGRARDGAAQKVAIVRLLGDGTPDPGFAALFPAGDGNEAAADAVAVQGDGKTVVAGYAVDAKTTKLMLARRLGNGDPDMEFGNPAGVVLAAPGDGGEALANALAIQPDGKLLVGGSVRDAGVTKLMLARFDSTGTPDMGFGSGGFALMAAGDGDDAGIAAIALQPDGKIVAAGHATDAGGSNVLAARFNADGSPDAGFGTGGIAFTPLGDEGIAEANALALQGDTAVVTGDAFDAGLEKTVLARYLLTAPASPPPGGGGGPPPDTTKPVITVSLTHKRFRVGAGTSPFTAAKRKRAPKGTTFKVQLSEAARTTLRIERARRGVKKGKRCVKPSKRRRGKRCTRFTRAGSLVRELPKGKSKVPFSGRIKRKALKPGKYRAVAFAIDAARNRSATKKLAFKVVRR